MSHEVTSAAYSRKPAWHGLGTVVPHGMFLEEAWDLVGLSWEPQHRPMFIPVDHVGYCKVPGSRAVVHSHTGDILGVVGNGHTFLSNAKLREIAQCVMDLDPSAHVESAMVLRGGADVVLLIQTREWSVRGTDDKSKSFLLLHNNHVGLASASVSATEIRVVCANTLAMAFWYGHNDRTSVQMRHTSGIESAADRVMDAMTATREASEAWEETANRLAGWSLTEEEAGSLLLRVTESVVGPVTAQEHDGQDERRSRAREKLVASIIGGRRWGASGALDSTAWDLLNRATGHFTHASRLRISDGQSSGERRIESNLLPDSTASQHKRSVARIFEAGVSS